MAPVHVGVVGHRFLRPAVRGFVEACCHGVLMASRATDENVRAVTALAPGTDSLFARAALGLDIPLALVSPFAGYERDPNHGAHRDVLERVAPTAAERIELPFSSPSPRAHLAAMARVVRMSHVVLFVWNGSYNTGLAATEYAIRFACLLGRPWVHVDVADLRVRWHGGGSGSPFAAEGSR